MSGYLADTSVFIAGEQDRPLGIAPAGDGRVSVVTLAELSLGRRAAVTELVRETRSRTLAVARRYVSLPFDEPVADELAGLLHAARASSRRAKAFAAIIAATALAHDLVVWTQDDDFAVLAELEPRLAVHRG